MKITIPGVVVGIGLTFLYHHFMKPLPAAKGS